MNLKLLIMASILSSSVFADVGDTVTTSKEVVGEIRAQSGGFYYFISLDGNWSTPNCPNAVYAYFTENLSIGKEIYSAALASKMGSQPIQFQGICGDDGGNDRYIKITYMTF